MLATPPPIPKTSLAAGRDAIGTRPSGCCVSTFVGGALTTSLPAFPARPSHHPVRLTEAPAGPSPGWGDAAADGSADAAAHVDQRAGGAASADRDTTCREGGGTR